MWGYGGVLFQMAKTWLPGYKFLRFGVWRACYKQAKFKSHISDQKSVWTKS